MASRIGFGRVPRISTVCLRYRGDGDMISSISHPDMYVIQGVDPASKSIGWNG
jgi:hypothetical protein